MNPVSRVNTNPILSNPYCRHVNPPKYTSTLSAAKQRLKKDIDKREMVQLLSTGMFSSLVNSINSPCLLLRMRRRHHYRNNNNKKKYLFRSSSISFAGCGSGVVVVSEEEDNNCHHYLVVDDSIEAFLKILPCDLHENLLNGPKRAQLLEVTLDLGRFPEARYLGELGGQCLRKTEVSIKELEDAQKTIGEFNGDNRAGIEGTLHRISAIRSRKGAVVGLTCRVGRAVSGHIDMVHDLLEYGESILFVGRPGVGKTTVMREVARFLSDELHRRVVIVDTSNEIGGDGDIPHEAIGGARRIQVPEPFMQHKVMIEAVENHMPEVIIVDEIGTKAEALACRSIAERGVMLIGTAHGERLENIIKNHTLSDLIGGIETVTLGDLEAKARKCPKSIIERKAFSTFSFLIEMRERHFWVAHRTKRSVDMLLNGKKPLVEVRKRDENFKVVVERGKTYDAGDI